MKFGAWWRSLAPRDARAIRVAAVVTGAALTYAGIARPFYTRQVQLQERLAQERLLYQRETDLLAQRRRWENLLLSGQGRLQKADPRLFHGRDSVTATAEVAGYVTAMVGDVGVVIQGSEAESSVVEAGGLLRLRVEVRAVTDLLGLMDWLAELEHGSKLLVVKRLSVTPSFRGGTASREEGLLGITLAVEGFARMGQQAGAGLAVEAAP